MTSSQMTRPQPALLRLTRNPRLPLRLRKKFGKFGYPAPGIPFTVPLFETRYSGKTGSHIDNKLYLYGLHEAATIRLMRTILIEQIASGAKPVLLDIGTNTGVHLLACSKMTHQAFGFEPWTPMHEIVSRHIADNKLANVRVFNFGLSDEDAELPFAVPTGNNVGVGSFIAANDKSKTYDGTKLLVRRGDDVLRENNIIPTLIKIDTEGFEYRVLRGLKETLHRFRPAVIFEYSDLSRKDFDRPEVIREIFGDDYRLLGIKRSREYPALVPFVPGKRYENLVAWPKS